VRLIMNQGECHTIYGKTVSGGEEFEVPDTEGNTWIAIGKAKKAEDPKPRRGRYNRADMRSENESRADLRVEED
jgi:hypothetical protein